MRVLIIEDHKESAGAMCKVLRQRLKENADSSVAGIECQIAGSLSEGLSKAVDFRADITILDPGLPDCTYEEAAKAIPLFPPPVIVVTDYVDDGASSYQLFCYQNGAANYFTKRQLRETIVTKEGQKLIEAITKAYWRSVLPTAEVREIHARALAARDATT